MPFELKVALEEYVKLSDISLDWLSLYFQEKDECEKKICFLKYLKYKKEREKISSRLKEISNKEYDR